MFTNVTLVGRVGTASEPKPTKKEGGQYVLVSVVTNFGYGANQRSDWHDIIAFGSVADKCAKYLKKGMMVVVNGRLQYNIHEIQGKKVKEASIVCSDLTMLSTKADLERPGQSASQQQPPAVQSDVFPDFPADNIPF